MMVETVETGRLAATWRGRVRGPAQYIVTWVQKVAAVLSKGWITSPYCANGHRAGAGAGEMFPARWLGLNWIWIMQSQQYIYH